MTIILAAGRRTAEDLIGPGAGPIRSGRAGPFQRRAVIGRIQTVTNYSKHWTVVLIVPGSAL
ncbi:hypothetical protein ACIBL3_12430 [Kribbella sp. NPDC050124]|uniref:hypothetical protein n=1 Tax=Kribbella sp. NPDC050124 TaxID=3364114 RepID=UPI0037A11699